MIRALFGGSFDPLHLGHTALVDHVLQHDLADTVHVVPAWRSPDKSGTVAPPTDRLAMAELAFGGRPRVVVESYEIDRGRPCYTLETLTHLQNVHRSATWLLVIGADNVAGFSAWHRADRLQDLATVLVLGRDGVDLAPAALKAAGLRPGRTRVVPDFAEPVSSSAVRVMLARGAADPASLQAGGIPAAVARYILARRLYLPEPDGEARVPDPD